MIKDPIFCLQFDRSDISKYSDRYAYPDDRDALDAGCRIAKGECSRSNLVAIFRWKTNGRGARRIDRNTNTEIADALHLASIAQTERAAISVLTGLYGVDVPVASAILTAIDPEKYTIIDFRALEALGSNSKNRSVGFYLEYLATCRKLASENGINLRQLDRALWQWSSERGAERTSNSITAPA
jgi:hypothetical protein